MADGMQDADRRIDLVFIIRWLGRHRLTLIVCSAIGCAIAVVWALLAPEIYRSEVVVAEANVKNMASGGVMSQLGGIASLAGINIGGDETGKQDRALLKSRRLAEEFIQRRDLMPVLFKDKSPKNTLWFGVRRFKERMLEIREDTRTELITVTIKARDPRQAADLANSYVALANEVARTRAIEEASGNLAYLESQITKTEVAELQRVLYELVENETKTLMLANARPQYAFRVIDPAVKPDMRDSPKRAIMSLLGMVVGFLAGIGFVYARGLWTSIRRPES